MRIAVLGLGFMGATHLKAIQNRSGLQLAAVSSTDTKALNGDLSSVGGNLSDASAVYDFSGVAKYTDAIEAARSAPALISRLPTTVIPRTRCAC